jgi:purine catabolism regulator
MPVRLSRLLAEPALALTPVSVWAGDRGISWISSSDLPDPTPFLEAGQVLLTTGTQFADGARGGVRDYVRRLHDAGVAALGFGTEVVRSTPDALGIACDELGMPLFEVPYRTPFIAVIRWAADAIAAEGRERDTWTIQAQRAVSTAALTRGGVGAAIAAFATQTGLVVVRFDAGGDVVSTAGDLAPESMATLGNEARRLLARSGRSAEPLTVDGLPAEVQTLGRSGTGRGALALVGTRVHDREVRIVSATAIALIEISLSDRADAAAARSALGAAFLDLARAGAWATATAMARSARMPVPAPPLLAAVGTGPADDLAALADAVSAVSDHAVVASDGHRLDLLLPLAAATDLADLGARYDGVHVGAAEAETPDDVPAALRDAHAACSRAGALGTPFLRAEATPERSLLRLVDPEYTRLASRSRLDGAPYLEEARVWLEQNARLEPAARELGIHRHSLRSRMTELGRRTGLDLDTLAGRSELWILLLAR